MKYTIRQKNKGRLHLVLDQQRLTAQEADVLYYSLIEQEGVERVQVFPRTAQVILQYSGRPEGILHFLDRADLRDPDLQDFVPSVSARATGEEYREKIIGMVTMRAFKRFLVPVPIRTVWTLWDAYPFILHGIKDVFSRNFSAEIVHASAIAASLLTRDFTTASSITFLTELGELLEEWTYKRSVDNLAQSLALNVTKVWKVTDGPDQQVNISQIAAGDRIRVTLGNLIPIDGVVDEGEAAVNQAALTGESLPVRKIPGRAVFAGTVIEEGELVIRVTEASGDTRYDKIIRMIEASEAMTPVTQSRAEQIVSRLIPYTFGTAVLTWLLTRNVTKAASVLMVDFSCAIEVAMPVATLSAMSEAGRHRLTVKGGKFLERTAEADTIVFDKTGTITCATPTVEKIVTLDGRDEDEMLRIAACLEEHFPHSLANAVVRAARNRGLQHDEMHSRAEYIVAHGITSYIGEERVIIGSYNFLFNKEGIPLTPEAQEKIRGIPEEYSHLYMSIGGRLAAVIGIADPIKEGITEVIARLKEMGIRHIVMMTGDSEKTAAAVARRVGITEYYAEVLPEDKAEYVEEQKKKGRRVIMIGDGINDSPALSAADVGIAIREGADIAQEIADVMISGTDMSRLLVLRQISDRLMPRMKNTAWVGIGFNAGILAAGLFGLVTPGTAAFLHNASTIGLCLRNMSPLVEADETAAAEPEETDFTEAAAAVI